MDYFLGEIRLFPYSNIPSGWTLCDGRSLMINANQALYSLLGAYYGGDGKTNFLLPNLNGSVIVGQGRSQTGTAYQLGKVGAGGSESVVLSTATIPTHNHIVNAGTTYDTNNATNELLGNPNVPTDPNQTKKNTGTVNLYAAAVTTPIVSLNPASITPTGSNTAHENRMPYLAMCYCIATSNGLYPPRPE